MNTCRLSSLLSLLLWWPLWWLLAYCSPATAEPLASWAPREQQVLSLVNEQRAHHQRNPVAADSRLHNAAVGHSHDMLRDDFFAHKHPDGTTAAQRARAAGYQWRATAENIAAGSGRRFSGGSISESAPLDAARDVMFGTARLGTIAGFAASRNLGPDTGFDWPDVGRGWSPADWDAWEAERRGSGGWMGSSGHRGNLLSARYTDIGVGYVFSASDPGQVSYNTYWTQQFASGDSQAPAPEPEPEPAPGPGPGPPPTRGPSVLAPILELLDEAR